MSKNLWKLVGVLGTVLVVGTLLISAVAFAQGPQNSTATSDSSSYQSNFIDEDGDGVCDLMSEDGTGMQNGSMNGKHGNMSGDQSNFIDEDGDGVCDLMNADGTGMQNGSMNGGQHGDMTGDALNAQDGTGNQYGRNGGSRGHGNK